MNSSIHIDVRSVTRVEGHGNILVDVDKGEIKTVQWNVPEAPRFFEAMVVGRDCTEVAGITSRICGICSIGHTFSSLKATEAAMGVTISEQTRRLRKILNHGENLQSHVLHVGYLALPDLLKVGSVIPLATTHKDAVLLVVKLHRLANETCDIVGGRTTHPIRTCIGGFTKVPAEKELAGLKARFEAAIPDLKTLAGVVKSVAGGLPDFVRETEYVSLTDPTEYALYDGKIKSTDVKESIPVDGYLKVTNEFMTAQSTAKWAKFNRASYMAGALARFNNNHTQLPPLAKTVAQDLELKAPCYNPYFNTVVQVVECVYSVEKIIEHLAWLLDKGIKNEPVSFKPREGRGVGAVDVPRGILFHDYTYDTKGKCVKANCIIPTNQNHANIQLDMDKLVPQFKDRGKDELQLLLEMLVRAYDPCISCSTH
ncbi:MAG TPA: Ni/Fe hydrogenase subunit alpha [Chitinivibrionales bacterium]|jgi:coenzyme F420-reducing hydrogenase alpha subunit|nr:Ni/Fe hydrogenase subunit alpha [Chitinivibrionales bacterium]